MEISIQIVYWLLIALMVVGVIGSMVPAIPGASLILIAIVIWGFVKGSFAAISVPVIVAGVVLLMSIGIDFMAGYFGAKKAGASKWGQIGAVVGLLLGFFGLLPALPFGGPLLGMLFGPLLGAIVGEFLYQGDIFKAIKAGIGITVGSLVGNLIQGILAIAVVGVFLYTTLPQVLG